MIAARASLPGYDLSSPTDRITWVDRCVRLVGHQQWLKRGVRDRLVRAACPPKQVAFESSLGGCTFRGRLDSYIDREVFYFGGYEKEIQDLLARLAAAHPSPVFLDIGANVGCHVLAAARSYEQVHAFEPYPPLSEILREQVTRNALDRVFIHTIGLGDVDEDAVYAAPADHRAGYGGFDNPDPNLVKHVLPMRRGDSYLRSIGVPKVDVIKIDVEGSERRVVQGLRDTLNRDRPALIVEYWPKSWPNSVSAELPAGYRLWTVLASGTSSTLIPWSTSDTAADVASAGSTLLALPGEWPELS